MEEKKMKNRFVHLHLHTDYSLLDGEGKVDAYVSRAKELGMTAMAITDHGTMAGLVTGFDACEKAGIKFIAGCEFYVAPFGRKMSDKKFERGEKAYNHLIVLAKNEDGYKNMCYLMTHAWEDGYYRKPRIDFDILKEHHDGLVVLTACVAGAVPSAIAEGNMDKARKIASEYKEVFGDDYYLEIQNHNLEAERLVRLGSMQLSKELGIKLVATNDCHYVKLEDKEAHDWLLCMDTDKKVADKDRLRYEGNYHMTSEEEMLQLFPECPEAVYNTAEVADKCNFRFTYGNYRMPKVHIPAEYGNDYFKYLSDETWKGFEKRYPEGSSEREEAKKDVSYELGIIKEMGFAEYFLDTQKTVMEAKRRGYLVGPGRGSGAGSRVNYCLEITDIDPIPYNLLFERFLNPERVSMPDIDVDYDPKHKDEIIKFENDSNDGCFAKIRTFTTMAAKAVLKGCAKVSGINDHVGVGNKFSKLIGNCKTMQEAWDTNPDLKAYVESSPQLQKIWNISLKLEGTKKAASTHACGHIPTPVPCEQLFPCAVDSETGYLVCEYDMTQVEHLGNLKKDLLMLSNLTTISAARDLIKQTKGIDVPLWTKDVLNDKDALALIASGDTDGVFQLESDGMKSFMKDLKPDRFEDIVAGVALYRPGPMSFIGDYIAGKQHPEEIKYLTTELKPILETTYGCIVYQEQVMQIVQRLAGFSMGRADIVRKAMGKV